mmetsp:Transcript_37738/g.60843  ORF Transcript_37738/g.60843 Transcript_37738/m.60843 type:complete len:247 (+) Transcript_37738:1731-2471(+)
MHGCLSLERVRISSMKSSRRRLFSSPYQSVSNHDCLLCERELTEYVPPVLVNSLGFVIAARAFAARLAMTSLLPTWVASSSLPLSAVLREAMELDVEAKALLASLSKMDSRFLEPLGGMTRFTATDVPRYSALMTIPKVPRPKTSMGAPSAMLPKSSSSLLTVHTASRLLKTYLTYMYTASARSSMIGTTMAGMSTLRRTHLPPIFAVDDLHWHTPTSSATRSESAHTGFLTCTKRGDSEICSPFA